MSSVPEGIAPAALHYAEAVCPTADADCIRRVAAGWERDVDQAFGAFASQPPSIMRYDVLARSGAKAGTLTYADGTVTLCWDRPPASDAGPRCQVLGNGFDAFRTAQTLLRQFGVQTVDLD